MGRDDETIETPTKNGTRQFHKVSKSHHGLSSTVYIEKTKTMKLHPSIMAKQRVNKNQQHPFVALAH